MADTIGFRPNPIVEQYIDSQVEENSKKTKTQIINDAIEQTINSGQKNNPSSIPTGILVQCPLRTVPVPYDEPFVTWKAPVDSSVCKSCLDYPCETWEIIKSMNRLGQSNVPTPEIDKSEIERREIVVEQLAQS